MRDSGDLQGSEGITLVGPKGAVHLSEGCIIAHRHIHMPTEVARDGSLVDGQIVQVETPGIRSLVLNNVKVRVDSSFALEIHLDTDEANAALLNNGDKVVII